MPKMGIKRVDVQMKPPLFNRTRSALFALLYGHPQDEYYVNQIMQIARCGSGAIQRELRLMSQAGLIKRTMRGNLVYYRANRRCPIFVELKSLADKGIVSLPEAAGETGYLCGPALRQNPRIKISRAIIAGFCRRHHIRKLSLFGSVLRDDFGPESDLDVLVEFMPGHTPGYFGLYDMEKELSALAGGRKADIRTSGDLSRYFRDQVIREASVQYEAAG